jgi:hypothetical protein
MFLLLLQHRIQWVEVGAFVPGSQEPVARSVVCVSRFSARFHCGLVCVFPKQINFGRLYVQVGIFLNLYPFLNFVTQEHKTKLYTKKKYFET